jgi:drug/metabolite transporter (DMT)-like permease
MILVLFLQTIFALSFIVYKKSLMYAPPFFLMAVRCFIATTILIGYQFFKDKSKIYFNKDIAWLIFIAAVFNIYITNAYELWGLQYVTAAKANFIYNISPFVALLMSYLFLNEKMTIQKWVGLLVGFFGFLPILLTSTASEAAITHYGFLSTAELALLSSAVATAIGWVVIKKLVYQKKYPVAMTNATSMLLAGFISLTQSYFVENWNFPQSSYMPILWMSLAGTALGFLIGYSLYIYLLKRYSNTFMAFAGLTGPFITAFFGWIFLGETVSWVFFASGFFVFLGLVIYYKQEVVSEVDHIIHPEHYRDKK